MGPLRNEILVIWGLFEMKSSHLGALVLGCEQPHPAVEGLAHAPNPGHSHVKTNVQTIHITHDVLKATESKCDYHENALIEEGVR